MNADVSTPCLAWREMAADRELVGDLMGGTRSMRRAAERWLPREPRESAEAYAIRLNRSVLFNGFARTVQLLAAKPFAKPASLSKETEPAIRELAADIDMTGRDISTFARDLLEAVLIDGVAHILVDHTRDDGEGDGPGRPYLVLLRAADLIGWRLASDGGPERLVEARIQEDVVEPDGPWGEKAVRQIRVLRPGGFAVWRREGDKPWRVWAEGETSLPFVPIVTVHGRRTGPLTGAPPLIDLAWLNLAHWQSASDQRHILHVVRVPILFGRNLRLEDGALEVGPNRMILGEGDGADLRFIEHSGAAINAGRQDLVDLEERMAILGLELVTRRPGGETATARALDSAHNGETVAAIVRGVEDGLRVALGHLAEWLGLPRERGGGLDIAQDFGMRDDRDLSALLEARKLGDLAPEAFLAELRRRGVIGEG